MNHGVANTLQDWPAVDVILYDRSKALYERLCLLCQKWVIGYQELPLRVLENDLGTPTK